MTVDLGSAPSPPALIARMAAKLTPFETMSLRNAKLAEDGDHYVFPSSVPNYLVKHHTVSLGDALNRRGMELRRFLDEQEGNAA